MPALVRDAAAPIHIMNSRKTSPPAVQAVGSPSKEVRFPSDQKLATTSRERTEREAWSFYWFETHCKDCRQCYDPYAVYKRGEYLCSKGEALAHDMSLHVYMRDGEVFERLEDPNASPDRVEIPHNYRHLPGQLRVMEKIAKRYRRRSYRPVVQHDQRIDDRKREDRYYHDRVLREDKPKSERKLEKKYEKSHRSDKAEMVVEMPRSARREGDDSGRSESKRHSHTAEYRREEGRDSRKEKSYVREERPQREKDYRREERYTRERRSPKDNVADVDVETSVNDKKYRTEIRKPEKEHRKSYYH